MSCHNNFDMRYTLAFVLFFQFNISYNIEGYYCGEGKYFTIRFEKPNKVYITETENTGHFPTYGYGTYEYKDNTIYINYTHHRNDSIIALRDNYKKDSLIIITKDSYNKEPIPGVCISSQKDILSKFTDIDGKAVIPRFVNEIQIHHPYTFSLHSISLDTLQGNISGYEIQYDQTIYIEQKKDTLHIESINDNEIILKGGYRLTKNDCNKKTIRF